MNFISLTDYYYEHNLFIEPKAIMAIRNIKIDKDLVCEIRLPGITYQVKESTPRILSLIHEATQR